MIQNVSGLKLCSNYLIPWNKVLYFCIFTDFKDSSSFEQPIFLYAALIYYAPMTRTLQYQTGEASVLKMKYIIMLTSFAI
jgi:hypothetical protein